MIEISNTMIKLFELFVKNDPTKRIINKLKKEVESYKASCTAEAANLYISCTYVCLLHEFGTELAKEETFINLYNEICPGYLALSFVIKVYQSLICPFVVETLDDCLSNLKGLVLTGENTYSLFLLFTQLYNSCVKRFHLANTGISDKCKDILDYFYYSAGTEFFVTQSQNLDFQKQPFSIKN